MHELPEGQGSRNGQMQLYLTLLPFTTQQLVMQNMMATAAAVASQQHIHNNEQRIENEMRNQITAEESESSSMSSNSKSTSPPGGPLNLTKGANLSGNDNDSLDRNSSDQSMNPSLTDQDSGSSQQNTPTEGEQALQFALSKLVALIEVATNNFKAQRDIIDSEKALIEKRHSEMDELRSRQQRIQRQLALEQRKSRAYFQRFCKAKRESLDLRVQLAQFGTHIRRRSV